MKYAPRRVFRRTAQTFFSSSYVTSSFPPQTNPGQEYKGCEAEARVASKLHPTPSECRTEKRGTLMKNLEFSMKELRLSVPCTLSLSLPLSFYPSPFFRSGYDITVSTNQLPLRLLHPLYRTASRIIFSHYTFSLFLSLSEAFIRQRG